MDPDQTLQDLRSDLRELDAAFGDEDLVVSVVEKVRALDEWLSKGGFAPSAWVPQSKRFNVNGSITYANGTGWTSTRTTPTVVIDSAIQGALTADAAIDVFIELIKSTHATDDSDITLSVVATDLASGDYASREEFRLTF